MTGGAICLDMNIDYPRRPYTSQGPMHTQYSACRHCHENCTSDAVDDSDVTRTHTLTMTTHLARCGCACDELTTCTSDSNPGSDYFGLPRLYYYPNLSTSQAQFGSNVSQCHTQHLSWRGSTSSTQSDRAPPCPVTGIDKKVRTSS